MKIYNFKNLRLETENGLNGQQIKSYEKTFGKLLGVFIKGVGYVKCHYDAKQIPVNELSIFRGHWDEGTIQERK